MTLFVEAAVYPSFLKPNLFFLYKTLFYLLLGCCFQAQKQIHFYRAVYAQYCLWKFFGNQVLIIVVVVAIIIINNYYLFGFARQVKKKKNHIQHIQHSFLC